MTNSRRRSKKARCGTESITDMIRNAGLEPSAELIKYGIIKGKEAPDIAALLHVAEDDFCISSSGRVSATAV